MVVKLLCAELLYLRFCNGEAPLNFLNHVYHGDDKKNGHKRLLNKYEVNEN